MHDAYDTPELPDHSHFAPARFRGSRLAEERLSTLNRDRRPRSVAGDDEFDGTSIDDFRLPPSLEPTVMSAPLPRAGRGMKFWVLARVFASGLIAGGAALIFVLSVADRPKSVGARPTMTPVVVSAAITGATAREPASATDRARAEAGIRFVSEVAPTQPVLGGPSAESVPRSEHGPVNHLPSVAALVAAAATAGRDASTDAGARDRHHSVRQLDAIDVAGLLKHGHEVAANGDLVGARLLFQRAAEAGDSDAALALAGTYDPIVLERLGERGLAPDVVAARYWYRKAQELGSKEAPQRLDMLASRSN